MHIQAIIVLDFLPLRLKFLNAMSPSNPKSLVIINGVRILPLHLISSVFLIASIAVILAAFCTGEIIDTKTVSAAKITIRQSTVIFAGDRILNILLISLIYRAYS